MAANDDALEVVICLGSSCFARGNSENLATLNEYAQRHEGSVSIRLTGRLCQDQCKQGPNLAIGGELYHSVSAARLRELLQQLGKPNRYGPDRGEDGAA